LTFSETWLAMSRASCICASFQAKGKKRERIVVPSRGRSMVGVTVSMEDKNKNKFGKALEID